MELSGQFHTPATLAPGYEHITYWIKGQADPRTGLEAVAKRREFNHGLVCILTELRNNIHRMFKTWSGYTVYKNVKCEDDRQRTKGLFSQAAKEIADLSALAKEDLHKYEIYL
jgi:hypothetical protein